MSVKRQIRTLQRKKINSKTRRTNNCKTKGRCCLNLKKEYPDIGKRHNSLCKNFTNTESYSQNPPHLRHFQTLFHRRFYTGDVTKKEFIFHFLRPRTSEPPLLTEHHRGNYDKVGRTRGIGWGADNY